MGRLLDAHLRGRSSHDLYVRMLLHRSIRDGVERTTDLISRLNPRTRLRRGVTRHIDEPLLAGRGRRTILVVSHGERAIKSDRIGVDGKSIGLGIVLLESIKVGLSGGGILLRD